MIKYRSIIIQIVYVLFGCAAVWSMIDSPFNSSADNLTVGYIAVDVVVIVWSLFMFISGFVALAKNVYNKTLSDQSVQVRMFAIVRMALAMLFWDWYAVVFLPGNAGVYELAS